MTVSRRKGWFDLPRDERRALRTMVWLVPALHVAVRVFRYRDVAGWLERRSGRANGSPVVPASTVIEPIRLAAARVAAYSPLPGNCLSRSLALWWLLKAEGIHTELRLGVTTADGIFAAHAWVERDGVVLNDRHDVAEYYRPLT